MGDAPRSRSEPSRLPVRRRPVHGVEYTFNDEPIVFITVCSERRRKWIADRQVHRDLVAVWREAHAWRVGRYVLMPDHVHLFASPASDIDLESWVPYWKRLFRLRNARPEHRWQKNYWDTRLRSDESYDEKWDYVVNNPVRTGLVAKAEDWPFAGEVNKLEF